MEDERKEEVTGVRKATQDDHGELRTGSSHGLSNAAARSTSSKVRPKNESFKEVKFDKKEMRNRVDGLLTERIDMVPISDNSTDMNISESFVSNSIHLVGSLVGLVSYTQYLEQRVESLTSALKRLTPDQPGQGSKAIPDQAKEKADVAKAEIETSQDAKASRLLSRSSSPEIESDDEYTGHAKLVDSDGNSVSDGGGGERLRGRFRRKRPKKEVRLVNSVKRWKSIATWRDQDDLYDNDQEFERAISNLQAKSFKKYAIECFHMYSREKKYQGCRFIVHSKPLINYLEEVLGAYPGNEAMRLRDGSFSIDEPFLPLFHNLKRLRNGLKSLKGEAQTNLELLLGLLADESPDVFEAMTSIVEDSCTEIAFDHLWLLYAPDTIFYARRDDEWEAYRVEKIVSLGLTKEGTRELLLIKSSSAGFDIKGAKLVRKANLHHVEPYTGKQNIKRLEHIPAKYLDNEAEIRRELIERGEQYWGYRSTSHCVEYHGQAWPRHDAGEPIRVIVDYASTSSISRQDAKDRLDRPNSYRSRRDRDDESVDQGDLAPLQMLEEDVDRRNPEAEQIFLYCPAHVVAFSLRNKDWRDAKIKELKPVVFAQDAFKKLVIENRYKAVVTAMVRSYLEETGNFKDLVKGKGKGLVVLLHGAPGTGKTLTAECVAEHEKRPLYMITSGDLGTDSRELEIKLRETFEYAVNWDAVLLLDEADVFLQERDVTALDRNALVSVFLRELEYFNGIMFLTTNRPGLLDEAFQSRIHITLHLPELNSEARIKIWAIFVKGLDIKHEKKVQLVREIKRELSNEMLNGRQIRNCMRAALALASQEKKPVGIEHIDDVVKIGKRFTGYMNDVNRMDLNQRAAQLGMRLTRVPTDSENELGI